MGPKLWIGYALIDFKVYHFVGRGEILEEVGRENKKTKIKLSFWFGNLNDTSLYLNFNYRHFFCKKVLKALLLKFKIVLRSMNYQQGTSFFDSDTELHEEIKH